MDDNAEPKALVVDKFQKLSCYIITSKVKNKIAGCQMGFSRSIATMYVLVLLILKLEGVVRVQDGTAQSSRNTKLMRQE